MGIEVTPFIFLLYLGSGFGMSFLFVSYLAHERLARHLMNKLQVIDSLNISLAVVFNSLFLLWSSGCLIGSYFGGYKIFMNPLPQPFKNLLSLETVMDILQKAMSFLALAVASLQMSKLGSYDMLVPWGATCSSVALLQSIVMSVMFMIFRGETEWIFLYAFSAIVSLCVLSFSIFSVILIGRNRVPSERITGALSNLAVSWNIRVCYMVLVSSLLDLFCRSVLVLIEIGIYEPIQLFVDLSLLLRVISVLLSVVAVYSARIPSDKSYSEKVFN